MSSREVWPGRPFPLGPDWDGSGTNFSLFSENAERVELCLFDEHGGEERIDVNERTAYNWHCYLPGVGPGTRYGYRVHGAYDPASGRRFNPAKLLIDPYAKQIEGAVDWDAANVLPYAPSSDENADLTIDESDSAPAVPKGVVVDPSFDWQDDAAVRPRIPWHDMVIYELHVKGFTQRREVADRRVPPVVRQPAIVQEAFVRDVVHRQQLDRRHAQRLQVVDHRRVG